MENKMGIGTIFNQGLTYSEYRNLMNKLMREGMTTGPTQTPDLVEFTKMNVQRMNRLDKTILLAENSIHEIQAVDKPMHWLVIAEAWCGDGAQIVPILNKIAEASGGKIELRIALRDDHPGLTEMYSNGSKGIPLLLIIDPHTNEVICTWGSRPEPAKEIAWRWKASEGKISKPDFEKELHLWYAKDKGITIINEVMSLIQTCAMKSKEVLVA